MNKFDCFCSDDSFHCNSGCYSWAGASGAVTGEVSGAISGLLLGYLQTKCVG